MWWNPVQSLQKHCSCCKTTWFGLLPVLKKSWTGKYLIYSWLFRKELIQKILSCLSHDQRSVTPKHMLLAIRQRVMPMWSITNDNLTNTLQHGISEPFLLPHSQQDEKHLSIFLCQAQNLQSLFFFICKDGICLWNRSSSHCIEQWTHTKMRWQDSQLHCHIL